MAAIVRALDPEGPLVPPPAGVYSNFENPPNGNETMNGVISLSLSLTIIAVTFHICGRLRNKFYIEDYLIIPAIAFFITCHVFVYRITGTTGWFVHGWNLQRKNQEWHLFNIYISTTTYNVTLIFLKSAILLQWARIFCPARRDVFFWMCYATAAVNAVFYLITILIELLRCSPVQYHWNKKIPGGHCANDDLLSPLSAAINLALDLTILILPQRVIWRLNLSFKKKVRVSIVFFVGILCIISAAARLGFAVELLTATDYAYDSSYAVLIGSLELTFAFLTFSLPGVPEPFGALMRRTRSSLEWAGSRAGLLSSSRTLAAAAATTTVTRVKSEGNIYHYDGGGGEADERGLVQTAAKTSSTKLGFDDDTHELAIPVGGLAPDAQDHAILRTTRFNMSETVVADANVDARGVALPRQHPWEPLSSKHETQ